MKDSGKQADIVIVVKESGDEKSLKVKPISYWTLFRFATRLEICAIVFGNFMAIVAGALLPTTTLVFGKLIG